MKSFLPALPLTAFLFLLTYVPGVTRGTITFHIEDLLLLAMLGWRAAHPEHITYLVENLKNKTVRWLFIFHTAFVVWTNLVNFFHARSLVEVLYAVTMFRSVAFLIWVLTFPDVRGLLSATLRYLPALGLLQQAITFAQAYNLFAINERLTPLYSTVIENSIYSLMGLRSDGTYANPNDASIGISFFAVASLVCWYNDRHLLKANVYFLGTAMTGLYATVFLCKSRTGTASLVFALIAFAVLAAFTRRKKHLAGLAIWALIGISGLGLGQLASDVKLQDRFSVFTGETRLTEEGSFAERLVMWQDGLALIWQNIETGLGVSELVNYGWLDGGYITYLFISGIGGLLLILCSLAPGIIEGIRARNGPLLIVTLQIALVTVSHPLAMKDKLWLPILAVFLCVAYEGERALRVMAHTSPQTPSPNIPTDPIAA